MSTQPPAAGAPDAAALTVVMVTHNSGATLGAAVRAVLAAEGVSTLLLVDNDSRDGSVDQVVFAHAGEPRLRVLRNAANPGFAAACNQGAASTRSAWLAFVNPDCFVTRDLFARLLAHARAIDSLGVLGVDVRDGQGAPEPAARRREPSFRRTLWQSTGLWRLARFWPVFEGLYRPARRGVEIEPVDAVSGAFMLMPREAFERLGGFDEGYRLHCEDLDLCRRARDAGLRVVVANQVSVVHLKGGSSLRRPLFVAWHKHRGMWRYHRKFESAKAPGTALLAGLGLWVRFALTLPWLLAHELGARWRGS